MGRHDLLQIRFSRGSGQNLGKVENKALPWAKMIRGFMNPTRTKDTLRQYAKLSDKEQQRLKAIDGFFYRTQVDGERRNRSSGRPSDLITLDFDNASPEFFASLIEGRLCGKIEWFLHTTRRHTPEKPRFRVLIPTDRPIDNDTYGPVSRIVALRFDPEFKHVDKVSFRPAQMMYLPTLCADSEYVTHRNEGDLIPWMSDLADFELDVGDWRDVANLPKVPGEELRLVVAKAEVPTEKKGVVGDFCRAYDIHQAIEKFLPDVYELAGDGGAKPRYTYLGGTTSNGAEVQDDGLFLYSHHGSDPCSDRLVNAFDMVRIHLFSHLDKDSEKDLPPGKAPSFKEMVQFLADDEPYIQQVMASRYDMAAMFEDADVEDSDEPPETDDDDLIGDIPKRGVRAGREGSAGKPARHTPASTKLRALGYAPPKVGKRRERPAKDWHLALERDGQGAILSTSANILSIVQNDVRLHECMEYNEFSGMTVTRVPLRTRLETVPAFEIEDRVMGDLWGSHHTRAVRAVLETGNGPGKLGWGLKVADRDLELAIDLTARQRPFHPIKDMLARTVWDGVKRAETLLIRYLKVPDNSYFRDIIRLWLIAGVARVMEPGHKFDFVPILEGTTGIRKSTFIRILGCGFFGELTADLHNEQKMVENMMGCFVMELPELSSIKRSDVESVKAAISRTSSIVRLAYDPRPREFKRQVIFMGSTNEAEYLVDRTGNRRWWPVHVQATQIDTDALAAEMPQVWAEAVQLYLEMREAQPKGDLPLYLSNPESDRIAKELAGERLQDDEADAMLGTIEDWLTQPLSSSKFDGGAPEYRKYVCLKQVWNEAIGMDRIPTRMDSKHLSQALRRLGWGPVGTIRIEGYGIPKAFTPIGFGGKPMKVEHWVRMRQRGGGSDDDLI